ncbi:hypothetical protein B0I37DRAFT_216237 [Chaetomium sp. MPI-CAGE-AT-0009]|nr:hypothetical protein B0I37DRAFT_216237 [Chaetomium sp. MPI-CAGE-AT-0009]
MSTRLGRICSRARASAYNAAKRSRHSALRPAATGSIQGGARTERPRLLPATLGPLPCPTHTWSVPPAFSSNSEGPPSPEFVFWAVKTLRALPNQAERRPSVIFFGSDSSRTAMAICQLLARANPAVSCLSLLASFPAAVVFSRSSLAPLEARKSAGPLPAQHSGETRRTRRRPRSIRPRPPPSSPQPALLFPFVQAAHLPCSLPGYVCYNGLPDKETRRTYL